jgi:arylsulfatase
MEQVRARRAAFVRSTIAAGVCAWSACTSGNEVPDTRDGGAAGSDARAADAAEPTTSRPNILLIVADDLGYSDIAAFGGEISTPNLDALAAEGRLLTDHHSGFTCAPTRSMLISGTDHHLVGLGRMGAGVGEQAGQPGYEGYLNERALSVAELLRDGGYHTYIAGKWHLGSTEAQSPLARGYERSYVLLPGVSTHFAELSSPPTQEQQELYREDGRYALPPADFYSTDFYTDTLISYIERDRADGKPFYAFAAYTSPHWPMQAPAAFIDRYRGRYDVGYDVIRERRIARQKELGIIPRDFAPNPLLAATAQRPTWDQLAPEQRAYEARRMEIYAAMVENLDYNIGRLIQHLKSVGEYEDTFIFFQSDNGSESGNQDRAAADNRLENVGRPGSYIGVGLRWAEVSATPFRLFKSQSAEGGHSVPAIARLPAQRGAAASFTGLTHLTDLVPTFLELAQVDNPGSSYRGRTVHPITGRSLLPVLQGRAITVRGEGDIVADEQNNSRYVRRGRWKLLWVAGQYGASPPSWQLFDLVTDRGETNDVAAQHPDVVAALTTEWDNYVKRTGVILDNRDGGASGDAGTRPDAAVSPGGGVDAGLLTGSSQ